MTGAEVSIAMDATLTQRSCLHGASKWRGSRTSLYSQYSILQVIRVRGRRGRRRRWKWWWCRCRHTHSHGWVIMRNQSQILNGKFQVAHYFGNVSKSGDVVFAHYSGDVFQIWALSCEHDMVVLYQIRDCFQLGILWFFVACIIWWWG